MNVTCASPSRTPTANSCVLGLFISQPRKVPRPVSAGTRPGRVVPTKGKRCASQEAPQLYTSVLKPNLRFRDIAVAATCSRVGRSWGVHDRLLSPYQQGRRQSRGEHGGAETAALWARSCRVTQPTQQNASAAHSVGSDQRAVGSRGGNPQGRSRGWTPVARWTPTCQLDQDQRCLWATTTAYRLVSPNSRQPAGRKPPTPRSGSAAASAFPIRLTWIAIWHLRSLAADARDLRRLACWRRPCSDFCRTIGGGPFRLEHSLLIALLVEACDNVWYRAGTRRMESVDGHGVQELISDRLGSLKERGAIGWLSDRLEGAIRSS